MGPKGFVSNGARLLQQPNQSLMMCNRHTRPLVIVRNHQNVCSITVTASLFGTAEYSPVNSKQESHQLKRWSPTRTPSMLAVLAIPLSSTTVHYRPLVGTGLHCMGFLRRAQAPNHLQQLEELMTLMDMSTTCDLRGV